MARSILNIWCLSLILLFVAPGCASTGTSTRSATSNSNDNGNSSVQVTDAQISLADYLRRIPGVNVRGSGNNVQIVIQGVSTFMGDTSPLFYLDSTRLGRNYAQVNSIINMHDVDRVEVVKGPQASAYGMEGTNGVIIIHTKRG